MSLAKQPGQASLRVKSLVKGEYRLKWPLAFLVAIYALAVVGLAVFQRRFLYFPDRRLTHPPKPV